MKKSIKYQVVVFFKIIQENPVLRTTDKISMSLGTFPFESYELAQKWIEEFENTDVSKSDFSFEIHKFWVSEDLNV